MRHFLFVFRVVRPISYLLNVSSYFAVFAEMPAATVAFAFMFRFDVFF